MKVKIVYGTETGTTQYVAEAMQKMLSEQNHQVDLYKAGTDGYQPDLAGYDMVLFGSPTYSEGSLEANMQQLVSEFNPDLSTIKVAVFSLGATGFFHFCRSAELLEQWVSEHKGKIIQPTIKIDGFPTDLAPIVAWVGALTN